MRFGQTIRFGLFLLGTSIPLLVHGQFQPPSKEELEMTADPKAPGADAVFLYREETTDDPHHYATVYARLKILTEKGTQAATVNVVYQRNLVYHATGDNSSRMGSGFATSWDAPNVNHSGEDMPNDVDSFNVKTDIAAIEGRTIHPDGKIIALTGAPSDLLKVKRGKNELNELTFTLPDVEVGSIIEYRYQVRYDRFAGAPNWQVQQPFFIHRAHFSFTPDEQFLPQRNKVGGAGIQDSALMDEHQEPMTDIRDAEILPAGTRVKAEASGNYTLDLSDIPALKLEPFSPPVENLAYRVSFYYVANPDEKDYWQKQMGYWNRKLNQYIEPTQALKNTVKEIIQPGDSELDKAKKLYAVTEKIENTDFNLDGEPGLPSDWIPAGHVDTVLQDKKATSNQIAYLYLAMARIAGLSARPERIASRSVRIFSPQFRDTSQLDSVVIELTIDGKQITVDPGTKMAPFQTLHWAHAAAAGLAFASNGKVETIITPQQKNSDNLTLHVGSLNVTKQGAVSGTLKIAFIGQSALRLRQMGVRAGDDAVKQEIDRMLAGQAPNGIEAKIDHVAYLDDTTKQLLAVVPVSGSFGATGGGRLVLPRNFFDTHSSNPLPADDARTLPVDMRYPALEQEQITYVLPAGYAVEGAPQDTSVKWEENAAYQLKSKADGKSVTTARVLARGFTLLDPKEYGGLRDFYQKVVTADQQQIVLAPAAQATNQ